MPDQALRDLLNAAIDVLDDGQRQRLLDWAGAMNATVVRAREPGASIGPIAEALHISNAGAKDGHATYRLDVVPEMLNPHGVLHGGAVYVMVDYSMGGATMSVLPAGDICATIEIKISYLAGRPRRHADLRNRHHQARPQGRLPRIEGGGRSRQTRRDCHRLLRRHPGSERS